MITGNIQKLISLFNEAFRDLELSVPLEKIESLAVRVHVAMTVHTRSFHSLDHVFTFVDPANPIRTLAALYHDLVYYQVDAGFAPVIQPIIAPYICQARSRYCVARNIPVEDRLIWLTLDIFDLKPGQHISSVDALNEFLSAVVMVKELEGIVRNEDMLRMILCIEATIPFRGRDKQQVSHFERQEKRLYGIIAKYGIVLDRDEVETAVKMSVIFANKDIENFAERDPGRFLDNTWRLLPETNMALRTRSVYTIRDYRIALDGMEVFLSKLDPDQVFNRYRGAPPDDEYEIMVQCARRNIFTAREYLRIKLLGIAILEALAEMTGGDAPLLLFTGDVPRAATSFKRIESYLPEIEEISPWVDRSSIIYQLLEVGRSSESGFDTKNSPLSLFVYQSLTPVQRSHAFDLAKGMFEGTVSAQDFLKNMGRPVVSAIAQASAQMVFTRRTKLLHLAQNHEP